MILTLDRELFLESFLKPIVIFNDQCSFTVYKESIKTVFSDSTNTVFCSLEFKSISHDSDENVIFNIADISKLIKALTIIDDDSVTLNYDNKDNKLSYKSSKARFNMHLLDPSILAAKKFDFNRITSMDFVSKFTLNLSNFKTFNKIISFVETEKLYFSNKGSDLYCELTDKSRANVDMFETILSNDFIGEDVVDLCVDVSVLSKLQNLIKGNMNVSVSSNKVILFEYDSSEFSIKIATSSIKV